jgi:hypothetical protein
MTFASKLGKSYEQSRDQAKLKTINLEIGNAKFSLKVRIPLKREMEELIEKISHPSEELVEAIYQKLAAPLIQTIQEGGDEFAQAMSEGEGGITITENDVIVRGSSVRQVAMFTAMWETKVEEYFHLLQSEIGDPINETYAQIADEFPESVIKQMVEDIEAAIKPDYKTAKKN